MRMVERCMRASNAGAHAQAQAMNDLSGLGF